MKESHTLTQLGINRNFQGIIIDRDKGYMWDSDGTEYFLERDLDSSDTMIDLVSSLIGYKVVAKKRTCV